MRSISRVLRLAAIATVALAGGLIAIPLGVAHAQPVWNATPGVYTANTTACTITGPQNFTGTISGSNCTFTFSSVNFPAGSTLNASGSRNLVINSTGNVTVGGSMSSNGGTASDFDLGSGPNGGAGGGQGGTGDQPGCAGNSDGAPGSGPGGGGGSVDTNCDGTAGSGAGGGGFGGAGDTGGIDPFDTDTPGAGGPTYGTPNLNPLVGGSGGGGGGDCASCSRWAQGGGGGGAIGITSSGTITLAAGSTISANGGNGAVSDYGASAGGSGGGILIQGQNVSDAGTLSANGGNGGVGGCCGDGGGGGGGRIFLVATSSLSHTGTFTASGGVCGVASTSGYVGPATGAQTCPTPTGAPGTINFAAQNVPYVAANTQTNSSYYVAFVARYRSYTPVGYRGDLDYRDYTGATFFINAYGATGSSVAPGINAARSSYCSSYAPYRPYCSLTVQQLTCSGGTATVSGTYTVYTGVNAGTYTFTATVTLNSPSTFQLTAQKPGGGTYTGPAIPVNANIQCA
jgi:hypothetical protein